MGSEQRLHPGLGILVAVFRVDHLTLSKVDLQSEIPDPDALVSQTDQVHLNSIVLVIEDGLMPECGQIEIRGQFAIEARQDVEVKSRGDTLGIIVSRLEDSGVLEQVNPQEEPVGGSKVMTEHGEKLRDLLLRKVANRGPQECDQPGSTCMRGEVTQAISKFADQPHNPQSGVFL